MGSRTISIPEDVYERLEAERRDDESVGDAIDRLLGRPQLSAFWGAWSEGTADRASEAIDEHRRRTDGRLDRRPD